MCYISQATLWWLLQIAIKFIEQIQIAATADRGDRETDRQTEKLGDRQTDRQSERERKIE